MSQICFSMLLGFFVFVFFFTKCTKDYFLFASDLDARPWDFQAEECALRANIERFNSRRYDKGHGNPDFLPVDNCLQSVLGQRVDLPEDFQMNYDLWLEREVFSKPISWEELLQ